MNEMLSTQCSFSGWEAPVCFGADGRVSAFWLSDQGGPFRRIREVMSSVLCGAAVLGVEVRVWRRWEGPALARR